MTGSQLCVRTSDEVVIINCVHRITAETALSVYNKNTSFQYGRSTETLIKRVINT